MKNHLRRALSLLLAIIMIMSLCPVTTFAEDGEDSAIEAEECHQDECHDEECHDDECCDDCETEEQAAEEVVSDDAVADSCEDTACPADEDEAETCEAVPVEWITINTVSTDPVTGETILTPVEGELSLCIGDTLLLAAVVLPENTDNKSVVWSVDNSEIAEIDSTGLVTAKAEGTVKITATVNDGSGVTADVVLVVSISETNFSLTDDCENLFSDTASLSYAGMDTSKRDKNYYEYAIWPLQCFHFSQLWYTSDSHNGQNAVDCLPLTTSGYKDEDAKIYAPFTGQIINTNTAGWGLIVFQSNDKVHYADGTVDYMTLLVGHDNNADSYARNVTINQGQQLCLPGTAGGYDWHTHIAVQKGKWDGSTGGGGNYYVNNAFFFDSNWSYDITQETWSCYHYNAISWTDLSSASTSINASYPCDLTVKLTESCTSYSRPGNANTYPESTTLNQYAVSSSFHATKIIENSVGHFWYQVDGGNEYIYSTHCSSSVTHKWSVSTSNFNKPTSLNIGDSFSVRGTVTTGGSTITQLRGFIYSGDRTSMTSPTDPSDTSNAETVSSLVAPNSTSYDLSGIDSSMLFNAITTTGNHTYMIKVTLTSNYLDGSSIKTKTKNKILSDACVCYTVGSSGSSGDGNSVTDAFISASDSNGYTITAKTTGPMSLKVASWSVTNDQDDLLWRDMTASGTNQYSYTVSFAEHNNECEDQYNNHIYSGSTLQTSVFYDHNRLVSPNIYDITVTEDDDGYIVNCWVSQSSCLDKVVFPTWTVLNGQDDLAANWDTNSDLYGTISPTVRISDYINANNIAFRVNKSDHNNEDGLYRTHIYAFDTHGIASCAEINWIMVGPSAPSKTTVYNGSRYELYDNYTGYSWDEAVKFCDNLGGHLVTITSAGENNTVGNLVSDASANVSYFWLGATDAGNEGNWKWITGESFNYTNWETNQPDNSSNNENYLELNRSNLQWNDIGTRANGIICEYDNVEYTVSYNANGGTNPPASQKKVGATALTLSSSKPSRTGYEFIGWALDANASAAIYQPGDTFTVDADTVLYAVWAKKYTITYDANGGSGAPVSQSKAHNIDLVLSSTIPTKANSVFLGWSVSKSSSSPEYLAGGCFSTNADTKLYAIWLENACYVDTVWSEWSTLKPSGVSDGMIESKTQYRYRDKTTITSSSSELSGSPSEVSEWTLYDSQSNWSDYSDWSNWSQEAVSESDSCQVESCTGYGWYYFKCDNCGAHMHGSDMCWTWCGGCGSTTPLTTAVTMFDPTDWSVATDWYSTTKYSAIINGERWFKWDGEGGGTTTLYRYRTRSLINTYYFYKWGEWSSWAETAADAAENREIETQTLYRYCTQTSYTHSWDNGVITKAATCKEDGIKTYTCSHCGTTKTETIAKHSNHTWSSWKTTKEATCKDDGISTRTCSVCGKTESKTISKHSNHTWGDWTVTVTETCKNDGLKARVCSVCGKAETEVIAKLDTHSWGDWQTTKEATCCGDGTKARTCSVCDKKETGYIPALGHDYQLSDHLDETCTTDGYDKYTCSRCSDINTVKIGKKGHNLVHHPAVAATCTTAGNAEYDTCTRCEYSTYVAIPATGHHYDGDVCDVCGELSESYTGAISVKLEQSYLAFNPGETVKLIAITEPEGIKPFVHWQVDGTAITIDAEGNVTANECGTATVTVSIILGGNTYTDNCRIDVVTDEEALAEQLRGIQLVTPSVNVEVYKSSDYATVSILPILEQNVASLQAPGEEIENSGSIITSAKFISGGPNGYFMLRVKDDRTLEIIPTEAAINAARTGSKDLKSSYSSQLEITAGGEVYIIGPLKFSVKKSLPSVKADKVVLNSYPAALGAQIPFTYKGNAVITKMELMSDAPEWLISDTEKRSFALSTKTVPSKYKSGKLSFSCDVEGWSVPITVAVNYSVKDTAPSLKFGVKTVTLTPGSASERLVALTVANAPFTDSESYPISVTKIEQKSGNAYAKLTNSQLLTAVVRDGYLVLCAPEKPDDLSAHTYLVTLSVAGKAFTYTVNTAAPDYAKFSAKITGSIDTNVELSPCVVTLSPNNFTGNSGEVYGLIRVEQYTGSTLISSAAKNCFTVTQNLNVFTFTEVSKGKLISGCSYKALFGVDTDGDGSWDGYTSVPLKISFSKSAPAIKVTLKASGSIDLARPASSIVLKPTVTNWYGEQTRSLVYYMKIGKSTVELGSESAKHFTTIKNSDGSYTIKAGESIINGATYSVKLVDEINGIAYSSSVVKLTVKVGKVTIKSSSPTLVLYKNDRYSRATFTLSTSDGTVAPIAYAEIDAASALNFKLVKLDNGVYGIEYKGNKLPASFKNSTIKLSVYLESCEARVAIINLKVIYK